MDNTGGKAWEEAREFLRARVVDCIRAAAPRSDLLVRAYDGWIKAKKIRAADRPAREYAMEFNDAIHRVRTLRSMLETGAYWDSLDTSVYARSSLREQLDLLADAIDEFTSLEAGYTAAPQSLHFDFSERDTNLVYGERQWSGERNIGTIQGVVFTADTDLHVECLTQECRDAAKPWLYVQDMAFSQDVSVQARIRLAAARVRARVTVECSEPGQQHSTLTGEIDHVPSGGTSETYWAGSTKVNCKGIPLSVTVDDVHVDAPSTAAPAE